MFSWLIDANENVNIATKLELITVYHIGGVSFSIIINYLTFQVGNTITHPFHVGKLSN